jgi:hypothetical protein
MPTFGVNNFSKGLDTKRHLISAEAGQLQDLVNAHVNRGGEIEKRRAFVKLIDPDWPYSPTLPPQTFGMEITGSGVFVFGSNEKPQWSWPDGVEYQRLQHPDGLAMTGVRWSSVYGAKPFVLAEFSNGDVIPYYNGVAVGSFVNGIVRQYMANAAGVADHFKTLFDTAIAEALAENSVLKNYTVTKLNSTTVRLTGKKGVPFESSVEAEAPMTITATKVQESTDDVLETVAHGSFVIAQGANGSATVSHGHRYAFYGSSGASVYPGITGIWIDEEDQELLSLAAGSPPLKGNSFIDGYSASQPTGSDANMLARVIAYYVNLQTSTTEYYATYSYGGRWSGADPGSLTIYAPNRFAESANGWTVWFEFEADPTPNAGAWADFGVDVSLAIPSPRNPGRWYAPFSAPFANGVRNSISSVRVESTELMRPGTEIFWKTSNAQLADDLVESINTYLLEQDPTPDYILTTTDTSKIVITARPGTGASFNGRRIYVDTNGAVGLVGVTPFSGGRDGLPGLPQITDFVFGGFALGKKLTITITDSMLTGYPYQIGASWVAGKKPNFTYTYKSKKFAGIDYSVYFSRLNDCTQWDIYDNGSGFINLSNNFSGRDPLTGIGVYQDKLAIFSRRNIQLFDINYDPTNDAQAQVIDGTGTIAPGSVVSANSLDLFFLADNGIRSVKARQNTVSAYSDDIGTPIDTLIINQLATMTEEQKRSAVAIIEPVEGRYWLALGNQVYVLSMYAGSQIFAWSRYEPGFNIEWLVNKDNLVYARSGDNIYIYGGLTGREYDSCPVTVQLPYMDAGTPQMYKQGTGVDLTIDGEWTLSAGFDYTAPEARDVVCTVNQSTYALGAIPMVGVGTHMGIKMVNQAPGPARVSNIVVHFRELHSRSSAG